MLGLPLSIRTDKVCVHLKPITPEHLSHIITHFNSIRVHLYTRDRYAQTIESEIDWYHKVRTNPNEVIWGIFPEGQDLPVGVTGLHDISRVSQTCVSGIIIFVRDWWGRGVATASHLCRTIYASEILNRSIIHSVVNTDNPGSFGALHNTGYVNTGSVGCTDWSAGRWVHDYYLTWYHPERLSQIMPHGLDDHIANLYGHLSQTAQLEYQDLYEQALSRAQQSLDYARAHIIYS
jgi:RimJ/RimL family protein N-acetyltransferase